MTGWTQRTKKGDLCSVAKQRQRQEADVCFLTSVVDAGFDSLAVMNIILLFLLTKILLNILSGYCT